MVLSIKVSIAKLKNLHDIQPRAQDIIATYERRSVYILNSGETSQMLSYLYTSIAYTFIVIG